jgi:hypothetical protein
MMVRDVDDKSDKQMLCGAFAQTVAVAPSPSRRPLKWTLPRQAELWCFSATPRDDGEERQAELCGALAQNREMMVKSDKQIYVAL